MKNILTVAILGCGFMGSVHAEAWRLVEGCVVKGVWSRNYSRAANFAAQYGMKHYSTLDDVLNDKDVDIVDVCTPTYTHADYTVRALEAAKHVIVEKPMALNLGDADRMISAADRSGMKLMVAHVLRFFPDYLKVRELVVEGALGEICQARAFRGGSLPDWSPWFAEIEKSGGVVIDLAIHDIDFITWLSSSPPQRVYAKIRRNLQPDTQRYDYAIINVRYGDGMIALVEGSWAHPPTFPFTMRLELDGTLGTMKLDNQSPIPVTLYSKDVKSSYAPETLPWRHMVRPLPLDPFYRELAHFADCVRGDKTPLTDGRVSRKSLEIAIAAVRSAESGKPVSLPLGV